MEPVRDAGPRRAIAAPVLVAAPASAAKERYFTGYLAEVMRGDLGEARAAYREVLERAGRDGSVAARAALRLAEIEALIGRRNEAVELVARAMALGRDDVKVVARADRLQARLASLRSQGSEVRGPPAGIELPGVTQATARRFARAEKLLAAYHRVPLRPRLEALRARVIGKESAVDNAVRAYRQVIGQGELVAVVASEFRIASLYHDLAISLMFNVPPELEAHAAAKLRRQLRGSALAYLRKALSAYRRGLDAARRAGDNPGLARWRNATERGMNAVVDMLGGGRP